jgi:hypothetical protein
MLSIAALLLMVSPGDEPDINARSREVTTIEAQTPEDRERQLAEARGEGALVEFADLEISCCIDGHCHPMTGAACMSVSSPTRRQKEQAPVFHASIASPIERPPVETWPEFTILVCLDEVLDKKETQGLVGPGLYYLCDVRDDFNNNFSFLWKKTGIQPPAWLHEPREGERFQVFSGFALDNIFVVHGAVAVAR